MAEGPVICIGVDFSDCGKAALESGARLARDLGASVVLVHALKETPAGQGIAGGQLQRDILLAKASLQEDEAIDLTAWAEEARSFGIDVETYTEEGDPATLINAQAAAHGAAIIVVGTHGRTGLRRVLMGSTAESVLRHADRPVVVVPCK